MSSTGRPGVDRIPLDVYGTPPFCVKRFLEAVDLPGGRWLEPCGGDGILIKTVNSLRPDISWSVGEIREEMRLPLSLLAEENLIIGDFLETKAEDWGPESFDVTITNPPFGLALPFIQKCLTMSKKTAMLLRLNFWGSVTRQQFLSTHPPKTFVLPNRPVFSVNKHGKPGTDSPEYAWFLFESEEWYQQNQGVPGTIQVLGLTPKEERKAWTDVIRSRSTLPPPSLEAVSVSLPPAPGLPSDLK